MADVLQAARAYVAAGLSVIAVRANGTKAPMDSGWRTYSDRRPTDDELRAWFNPDVVCGIGIPGGPASGNLAVLDFERWSAYEAWLRSLPLAQQALTRPCPLAATPGGGAHLYCRLTDPVRGTALAYHLVEEKEKILIEVRANGEQVVAPGSPAQCHRLQKEYEWLRRGWLDRVVRCEPIDLHVWFDWLLAAEALNQVVRKKDVIPADTRRRDRISGNSPGQDFNHRGTWEETGLFDAGWQWHRCEGNDRGFLTRPGKGDGVSGSVGMVVAKDGGHDLFYCFTSNGGAFAHKGSYSRYRVYALLKHKADFAAAAKVLADKGYGQQRTSSRGVAPAQPSIAASPSASPHEPGPEPPRAPTNGTKPPLPLVYYSEITPALDAADFVEGLLTDGAMSIIYGESGCGKTFFVLDLALHVAAGLRWRGREVDQRGVLYLALEGSYGIRNRVAAFKLAHSANAIDLPFVIVPVALNLLAPDGDVLRVIEAAREAAAKLSFPVGLVIVDTLSRAIAGGNENASEDMGRLVNHLDVIRQTLKAHTSGVHHSGKDGAKGARGHSLLRAATDTEIEVTRDHVAKTSIARVTKQREIDLSDEFVFRLEPVPLGINRRGKPVVSCVVRTVDTDCRPSKEDRAEQEERARRAREREREKADEDAVLAVVASERAKKLPGASMRLIERESRIGDSRIGRVRAKAAVEGLVEDGRLVELAPFKKPGGNGAQGTVTNGYGPPNGASEEG